MRTNRVTRHPLARLAAGAAVVGSTSLLLVGALQVPAGAATGPFNTTVTVVPPTTAPVTGQSVKLTAKVASPLHGTPGGTVTFSVVGADASVANCDGGTAVAFTGGTAVCTISGGLFAASGPYTVTAAYTDTADLNYNPSSGTKTVTPKAGHTTTVVTSSVNPSVTGEAVSFTAAVAPVAPSAGSPTGTVTFSGVTCDGVTNAIAVSGGLAQCIVSGGLAAQSGPLTVGGVYSGDGNYLTSSGSVKQSVGHAAATLILAATPNNCTGDICTTGQGTAVAFTGTVASTGLDGGSGVPTGSLVFSLVKAGSKTGITCDGGSSTIPLVAGQATCNVTSGLVASVYFTVTATLVSTGYAAPSATLYENSQLSGTNTTIGKIPSQGAGQTFTVVATVTPVAGSGSTPVGGSVNVLVCGANSNGPNSCQGGAAPVGAGGVAQFAVDGGEFPGIYTISAVYTGDANYFSSTAKNKTLTVGKSVTVLNLSQYGGFVTVNGQAATITATVVAPDGAAGSTLVGPPTGNVTFAITDPGGNPVNCAGGNVVTLATGPGQVEGTATCFLPPDTLTTTPPASSTYIVHANYGSDSDYTGSNSQVNEVVVPAAA